MLKRIDVADVRLGMYIHKLEGPWLKHPFWKTKFLLTDADQLADLHASELEAVVIDVEKGDDVGGTQPVRRRQLVSGASRLAPIERGRIELVPQARPASARPFDPRSTSPLATAREVSNAVGIVARSERILAGVFNQARLGKAIKSSQVEPVIEELFASIQRNPHAFNGLMRVKRENSSLYTHALAVSALMIALGRQMRLDVMRIKQAGMAGLLMDVGMGHLPLDVSTIMETLTDAEHEVVKTHTRLGYDFLAIGGEIPEDVMKVCLEHHERFDGSGYPLGLAGHDISLFGRMAAVCDVYDSMTSDRPHRARMEPNQAFERMRGLEGQFDPEVLTQFIESLGVYPIGSVVLLSSSRLALVVDQNPDDYTRPRVWTFYDTGTNKVMKPEDINLIDSAGHEEIVSGADPEGYNIPNFSALREMVFTSAAKALA
ncbi:MAG TPA: HD-GYP domain-containing protein [Sphingobium sp.]|nr:HD-GYP domain-containing protein [Sphingobium sp.]